MGSRNVNDDEGERVAAQFGVAAEQVERDHFVSHVLAFLSRRFIDQVHTSSVERPLPAPTCRTGGSARTST